MAQADKTDKIINNSSVSGLVENEFSIISSIIKISLQDNDTRIAMR